MITIPITKKKNKINNDNDNSMNTNDDKIKDTQRQEKKFGKKAGGVQT